MRIGALLESPSFTATSSRRWIMRRTVRGQTLNWVAADAEYGGRLRDGQERAARLINHQHSPVNVRVRPATCGVTLWRASVATSLPRAPER